MDPRPIYLRLQYKVVEIVDHPTADRNMTDRLAQSSLFSNLKFKSNL